MKPSTFKASLRPKILAICLCLVSMYSRPVVGVGVINGGFETGTLEGWTASMPGEVYVTRSRDGVHETHVLYPYDSTTIPLLANFATVRTGSLEGTYHAHLRGLYSIGLPPTWNWTMEDGWTYSLEQGEAYALRLAQVVHLSNDMLTLSGWANYGTWCVYEFKEHNRVSISVNSSEVWFQDTSTVPLAPGGGLRSTGWEAWTFTAPSEGDYTLALDVASVCQFGAYAKLDGVNGVPEPVVGSLILLGAGMFFIRRHRR